MICDEQQGAAVFHPFLYHLTLFFCKSRLVRAFVIQFFRAERIGNHQHFETAQRGLREWLAIADDAIAVVGQQIDEWFVTPVRGVEVVMCFIEHHTWTVFLVGGLRYSRVEFRVCHLLGLGGHGQGYEKSASYSNVFHRILKTGFQFR